MLEVDLLREAERASVYTSPDSFGDSIQHKRMLGVRRDFLPPPLYDICLTAAILENVLNLPMVDGQDQHSDVKLSGMRIPKKIQCCRRERAAEALYGIVCQHTWEYE